MVPLCYRTATVNGLKKPACILHAPFSDVQDANEMRMVEDATQDVRQIRPIRQIRQIGLIGGWRDRTPEAGHQRTDTEGYN